MSRLPQRLGWATPSSTAVSGLTITPRLHGSLAQSYPPVSESVNASKWTQPYFCVLAAISLYRGLTEFRMSKIQAWMAAGAAAISPVVVAQLGTNYVDGLLGSALAIQIGASLSWHSRRMTADLLIAIFGCMIATNLKFTGAVYSISLLFVLLAATFLYSGLPNKCESIAVSLGGIVTLFVSAQTYLYNWIIDGYPFYPLNKFDVMKGQSPSDFFALDRWQEFLQATFLQSPGYFVRLKGAGFFMPRIWHYKVITAVPDAKMAAFGSLFGWSFIACLVAVPYRIGIDRGRPSWTVNPCSFLSSWAGSCSRRQ